MNLCISNGCPLYWVVNIWSKVLNNIASLKKINKYRLRNRSIIWGICQVLIIIVTRKSDALCRMPHRLCILFDCFFAQIKEFASIICTHFFASLFLDCEFYINSIPVYSPGKENFLTNEPLTSRNNVYHTVLRHCSNMPCATRIWRRCIDNKQLFLTIGVK